MNSVKKKIMIIDDDKISLMAGNAALEEIYDVITINNSTQAVSMVKQYLPDLILLDIHMPVMDGFEVIREIKTDIHINSIPVIFLTALSAERNEYDGLSLGAVDYITKPFNKKILRKRIETHLSLVEYSSGLEKLVEKKSEKIIQLQDAILSTVAELVEFRDKTTGGHIDRTTSYLHLLIDKMADLGLYTEAVAAWDVKLMIQAAQLHDVGKIGVPENILNKPGKLTDEEFEVIKLHAQQGKEAIEKISSKVEENEFLNQAAIMAYTHHERWDGTGYPQGLKGEDIPLHGRLMAIADVYDALISERPYKKPYTHEEAVEIIKEGRGTQFDPLLTDLFIKYQDAFRLIAEGKSP